MYPLSVIGRTSPLFEEDIASYKGTLDALVETSSFLVIGGAGSIGQSVCEELFVRRPKVLHVVDLSENNMVELVRRLRSSAAGGATDLQTFAIDCGGIEFESLMKTGEKYDYVFNLSALKHVRSEKDPFTLMRLIHVNVLNMIKTTKLARDNGCKKYFCVSTDKAANPVNMMGASKRIMELFLMREGLTLPISMARFANVAFSDGSLLHGFNQRIQNRQPISAPIDIERYFVTAKEAGQLCLFSGLMGVNGDIFFPKLSDKLNLIKLSTLTRKYLEFRGYKVRRCFSEDEARENPARWIDSGQWPCYFFESDTSGEKPFEEFFTDDEDLDMESFENFGVIRSKGTFNAAKLDFFESEIEQMLNRGNWNKNDLVGLFKTLLPNFEHLETEKNLDQKM
jgi:FlaA1/EpsC-like NDP-sugar epimerase